MNTTELREKLSRKINSNKFWVISGFRREADEDCALLVY